MYYSYDPFGVGLQPDVHFESSAVFDDEFDLFPVALGVSFVLAYKVAGLGVVLFAPPWLKPVGVAMLWPGPADPALFALGYLVGQEIQERW